MSHEKIDAYFSRGQHFSENNAISAQKDGVCLRGGIAGSENNGVVSRSNDHKSRSAGVDPRDYIPPAQNSTAISSPDSIPGSHPEQEVDLSDAINIGRTTASLPPLSMSQKCLLCWFPRSAMPCHVDDLARKRWIASHIYPLEPQARRWLKKHIRSLSNTDADDLVQEAYARICRIDIARIQNPATYLYVALRNLLMERARHSRVIPLERLGEIDELSIPLDEISPDRRVSARQELEQLSDILERLPPQCRRVFELRKLEGLSQRETAAALGISERTVEKHLAKAFARVIQLRRQTTGTEAEQHDSTSDSDDTRREQD